MKTTATLTAPAGVGAVPAMGFVFCTSVAPGPELAQWAADNLAALAVTYKFLDAETYETSVDGHTYRWPGVLSFIPGVELVIWIRRGATTGDLEFLQWKLNKVLAGAVRMEDGWVAPAEGRRRWQLQPGRPVSGFALSTEEGRQEARESLIVECTESVCERQWHEVFHAGDGWPQIHYAREAEGDDWSVSVTRAEDETVWTVSVEATDLEATGPELRQFSAAIQDAIDYTERLNKAVA